MVNSLYCRIICLACQVKQDITPSEFWKIAISTGDIIDIEEEGSVYKLDRVVNPVRLIQFLEQTNK